MKIKLAGLLFGLAAMLPFASQGAETYAFDCITNNNPVNCATGEGQLTVTVSDAGGGQVAFRFDNSGPLASSITDVYFDDGTLLGIASITDSGGGVAFSQGASPGDLPGGNNTNPDFEATAGFTADSDPPTQPNGVNPAEWLTITFNLIGGQTYADTLAALLDGTLRIGIHVQGFADGGSDSFVNFPCRTCPPPGEETPEPGTLALLGLGLLGIAALRRRRT